MDLHYTVPLAAQSIPLPDLPNSHSLGAQSRDPKRKIQAKDPSERSKQKIQAKDPRGTSMRKIQEEHPCERSKRNIHAKDLSERSRERSKGKIQANFQLSAQVDFFSKRLKRKI